MVKEAGSLVFLVQWPSSMLMTLSPSPAPSFDYADMPSPLGESENTITVLLRPAQGRGAPIRWESGDGGMGGQGHGEESPPLTQSPNLGQLTLFLPQSPMQGSECLEEDVLMLGRREACSLSPLRPWVLDGNCQEDPG